MLDLVRAPNEPAMLDHCSEVRPEMGRHEQAPRTKRGERAGATGHAGPRLDQGQGHH